MIGPPARFPWPLGGELTILSLFTDELGIKLAGSDARNDDSDGGSMGGFGDDGSGSDIESKGAVGEGGGDEMLLLGWLLPGFAVSG